MTSTENFNVSCLLARLAKQFGDRPCLIDLHKGLTRLATFADLENEVQEASLILRAAGIGESDAVLIYVPLQKELISLLLAVFRIGATAVFIDPAYNPQKFLHCLRLAKPTFVILDKKLEAVKIATPLLRGWLGIKDLLIFDGTKSTCIKDCLKLFSAATRQHKAESSIHVVAPEHPALITFTSGSTGMPKGIVRSHGFLIHQSALLQKTLPVPDTSNDLNSTFKVFTTLPMFILAALAAGQTSVIAARDDMFLLQQLKFQNIDRVLCAPHTLQSICALLSKDNVKLPVKQVIVGGGPIFPALLSQVDAVMPQAQVTAVYGSTEAEPICHQIMTKESLASLDRGLPCGKPIVEIALHIVNPRLLDAGNNFSASQLEAMTVAAGQEGEVVVSGAHVVPGYLCGIGDKTTKFKIDGRVFHRTGDAGYLDTDGALFLTGRVADAVSTANKTIYPFSAELLAMGNTAVERCALISIQNKSVMAIKLNVNQQSELVLSQLKNAFEQTQMHIDKFVIVQSLPLDERHQSKVVYGKLKKQLAGLRIAG